MAMFKLRGRVKVIKDTTQITDTFSKREFVVTEEDGMYPQDIMFELVQDKCSVIDGLNVGDEVEVSFNIRGREWTSPQGEVKYFNSLNAWRVEKVQAGMAPQTDPSPVDLGGGQSTDNPTASNEGAQEADDLPF